MKFEAVFSGSDDPFEGERTLWIKGLPQGVQVESATVTLTPVPAPGRKPFEEVLTFSRDQERFGGTKLPGTGAVEVDFHARRTLQEVRGINLDGTELLVDLGGGVFMEINERGAIFSPQDDAALFTLQPDHLLPGLTVTRFRLREAPSVPANFHPLDVTQITVRSAPSQVSLAVNDQPPFWTHTGEMTTEQTTRDFAESLQAYLDEEAEVVNGFFQIPLVLHTDSLARLSAGVKIEYQQQQSALPADVSEVALSYAHDGTAQAETELIQVAIPAGAEVTSASVQVVGAFDDSRILVGPTGPVEPSAAAPVSAGFSQAQPILLAAATPATAIDLLLSSVTETAVIDLNLRADVDGRPFDEPLLPAPVAIELNRELAGQPTWLSARLPAEFQFLPGERYWLQLQSRSGEAVWHATQAEPGSLGMLQTTNDGLSWRLTRPAGAQAPLAAYFRLRHTPERYTVPLEVLVGRGESAERVSLDRFAPLKRIDFAIDFPEFAQAINRAARREETARCPQGEQLGNPNFERWRLVDQEIGEPEPVSKMGEFTVAAAPNGRWVFTGRDDYSDFLRLPDHGELGRVNYSPASHRHLAVSSDSRRVYHVDSGTSLHVLDGETYQAIGDPVLISSENSIIVYALALSPDAKLLYLAVGEHGNEIRVVDTAVLEQLLNGPAGFNFDQSLVPDTVEAPNPIMLGGSWLPTALAISPDGRRLFVAGQDGGGNGSVVVYDTASRSPLLEDPIPVGSYPADLRITPDGRWALVANSGEDTLSLLDAPRMMLARTIQLPNPQGEVLQPEAIAIAPDGVRAFIVTRGNQAVYVLRLADATLGETLRLGAPDRNQVGMAVTPIGDRLYVALGEGFYDYYSNGVGDELLEGLVYVPIGHQHPEEWTLTTGFVTPVNYTGPGLLAAVLGSVCQSDQQIRPARPSSLSQVLPITSGCPYTFEFWGIANVFEAAAEVIWHGSDCGLERIDRVPIQLLERRVEEKALSKLSCTQRVKRELPELRLHRVRLDAPPGAEQAEIRFLIPPEKYAIIDTVSFQSAGDPLANGDLQFVQDDELVGWSLAPAEAATPTLVVAENEVQITNNGSVTVLLFQTFPVTGAQPFVLELMGKIVHQLGADAPRVELRWLTVEGDLAGDPTTLAIIPGDDQHRLTGTVPAGAAQSELHLVIPTGTTLGVQRVSFIPVEIISVPIEFIAQAPGELTVQDFRVTYEVGAPTRPPVPEAGLCKPTPPVGGHGGKPGGACPWCPTPCEPCTEEEGGEAVEHEHFEPVSTPAPRPVPAVTPQRRAAVLTAERRPLDRQMVAERPGLFPIEAEIAAVLPAEEAGWARLAGELVVVSLPLETIGGIAVERAETLRRLNITNIPQLAAADREQLAQIRGISLPMADSFITQARGLLDAPERQPAPLVSCVMPTFNRRAFVPQAIAYFLRQDYPRRELIILDDSDDPVADLIPDGGEIRYLRLEGRHSIGAKRNRGAQEARGPLLANWDDDMWVAPWRLSYQVAALLQTNADLVGIEEMLHYDPFAAQAWHSRRPPGDRPWMPGSSFLYLKTFWEKHPYSDIQLGEDIQFLRQDRQAKLVPLQAVDWLVDIIHGGNVSPKSGDNPLWFPIPVDEIKELMGKDWDFYQELVARERG